MFLGRLACCLLPLAAAASVASAAAPPDPKPVAIISPPGAPKFTVPISLLGFPQAALPSRIAPAPAEGGETTSASAAPPATAPVTGPRVTRITSRQPSTRITTRQAPGVPIPSDAAPSRPTLVESAVPEAPPGERPRAVAGGWIPQEPFTVHADIESYVKELRESIPVDLGASPIRRDVYLVTEGNGLYPLAGPHMIAMDPGYMRRHLAKLRHDVTWHVPENADVLCVLDWESWWPVWEMNEDEPSPAAPDAVDRDFRTDWRDYIRTYRPLLISGLSPEEQEQVFKETFERQARDFFVTTIRECKRIRPRAKWTWYALPFRSYWDYKDEAKAARLRGFHDNELAWLWPEVDFLAPSIYCFYQSCESGCDNTPADDRAYIEANLAEAIRVANGKPVYAYIWGKYHSSNQEHGLEFLNEVNLTNRFQIPFDMGVDGVILFELIKTTEEANEFETYFRQSISPEINRILTATR